MGRNIIVIFIALPLFVCCNIIKNQEKKDAYSEVHLEQFIPNDQETFLNIADDGLLYVFSGYNIRNMYERKYSLVFSSLQSFQDTIHKGNISLHIDDVHKDDGMVLDSTIQKAYQSKGLLVLLSYCETTEDNNLIIKSLGSVGMEKVLSIAYFFYINGYDYSYSDVSGEHILRKSETLWPEGNCRDSGEHFYKSSRGL